MADYSFIDTHLHVEKDDNIEELYETSLKADVNGLVFAGTTAADSLDSMNKANMFPNLWSTVGVHPHHADDFCEGYDVFKDLSKNEKVVAIGEIGLDYFYDNSERSRQIEVFEGFLALALEVDLPVVIHCREAFADCLPILKQTPEIHSNFLIHSFTGTPEELNSLLEMNALISYNGMLTFNKAKNIRDNFQQTPLGNVVLETDSPYLAPVPHRGKRNFPAYVPDIAKRAADELNISVKEIADTTTANAERFFNIKLTKPEGCSCLT